MSTSVKYNNIEVMGPPYFSRTIDAVDYGHRWGSVHNITLNGFITGVANGTGRLNYLNSVFSDSFKDLLVESNGNTIYEESHCILESISFGNHSFPHESAAAVPYTVKMKAYEVPSGVVDVSSLISYQENPDGTVDISHKTSAKGLKTNLTAIENAYNFVNLFTGINPLLDESPMLVRGASQAVLLSVDENVDRLEGTYEVSEKWKYETGSSDNYLSTFSLSVEDDVSQEFVNLNMNATFVGSIQGDFAGPFGARAASVAFDYYAKLAAFGIATGSCILNSFSSNESPDSNSVSLNLNFFSGDGLEVGGVFENSVTMDWDEVKNLKTYNINSEFKIKGPNPYREERINAKKHEILSNYDHYAGYLYNVIKDSKVYTKFGSDRDINPLPSDLSINEGETTPSFSLSASYDDSDYIKIKTATLTNEESYPISAGKSEWSINVAPEKWLFSIQKAVNIEGHIMVQDLQCKSRERVSIDSSVEHIGGSLEGGVDVNGDLSSSKITDFVKSIESDIVALDNSQSLYLTSESDNSGEYDFSTSRQSIAKKPINADLSANKFYGFNASTYNTRDIGHQYGF